MTVIDPGDSLLITTKRQRKERKLSLISNPDLFVLN